MAPVCHNDTGPLGQYCLIAVAAKLGSIVCRRGEIKMKTRVHVPSLIRFLRYTSIPGVILMLLMGIVAAVSVGKLQSFAAALFYDF